jgi:nucleotide-binding universal stress UspA family protein
LISDRDVDHIVGQAMNRHARFLDQLIEKTPMSSVVPAKHLVRGRPADAIIDFVASHLIGLLVMGTVGRTGIPGLLIGNTAERVLGEVTCSVLALKPRGFVSPVTLDS